MTPARFPHSDTPGSTLGCQLPRAYRRLLRPSSALDAKASTTCPSQLVTHTTNPTPTHTTRGWNQAGNAHNTPQRNTTHPHQSMRACNKQTQQRSPRQPTATGHEDARVHYPDLKQQPHPTPTQLCDSCATAVRKHQPHGYRWRTEAPVPPPSTTSTTGGPDSSEPQQRVCRPPQVCFHIFQDTHHAGAHSAHGLGACSLERR